MEGWYLTIGVIALLLIYVAAMYNSLVKLRQQCRESWSGIDTELKRRYELIPNLVETVRGYMKYERSVLESVVAARNRAVASTGSPASQAQDENALVGALRELFAVAENYPVLKASENFLRLQEDLADTEDRIQAARRFFNGNVRDYRNKCQSFPSNIIAGAFGFEPQDYFNVPPSVREVPNADFS